MILSEDINKCKNLREFLNEVTNYFNEENFKREVLKIYKKYNIVKKETFLIHQLSNFEEDDVKSLE